MNSTLINFELNFNYIIPLFKLENNRRLFHMKHIRFGQKNNRHAISIPIILGETSKLVQLV